MSTTATLLPVSPPRLPPPPPWPHFAADEIEAASAVLRSGHVNYWTGGEGKAFEQEYARFLGAKHVLAAANGSVTLEMALRALGVGPGDEVVVTPRSFVASASCVVNVGAKPIFADVDADSGNITPETVAAVITGRTKAILSVHLAGWPCDMEGMMALARSRGLAVVEDCAQAHGAEIRGRAVGTFGDIGSYSFCQDKIMTTGGEGGLLVTNDDALWERLWSLRDHGKSRDACFNRTWPPGFRWLHESFGSNHRLTEMQSAIGRTQLKKLPGWRERRARNAAALTACLREFAFIRVPEPPAHLRHAHYKRYCYVRPERLPDGWTRDRLLGALTVRGVPCFTGSCSEIYLEKAFAVRGLAPGARLPVARELGETALMFPVHPTITGEYLEQMISALREAFGAAELRC